MLSKFNPILVKHQGDRDEQQDNGIVLRSKDDQRILCVIADGMGGHSGGRKASACVISAAKDIWQQTAEGQYKPPEKMLHNIVQQAYKRMKACEEQENISPRSTCVLLFIDGQQAHYCHVGDSRLYHFHQQKLFARTKDHSVVQMLVDMGEVSEAEMGTHVDQGRLLKWIGGKESPQATFATVELAAGDQFLLCSDGLWEYVTVAQMERALQAQKEVKRVANHFIQVARKVGRGQGDNISLILCTIPQNSMMHWRLLSLGMMTLVTSLLAVYYFMTRCS